jgi:FlaA1/EpsC-like NDP-sugar epimerase
MLELTDDQINYFLGRKEFALKGLVESLNQTRDHFSNKKILIIGGAGFIGLSLLKYFATTAASNIHVLDLNENGLADAARIINYMESTHFPIIDFHCQDYGTDVAHDFLKRHSFDFVLNVAALKHVRNQKDFWSQARMLRVNAIDAAVCKAQVLLNNPDAHFFNISTDKATRPGNFMGATKQLMERLLLLSPGRSSSARFANVAFSSGSLLNSYVWRAKAGLTLPCPSDIRRYFITPIEAVALCIDAIVQADNLQRNIITIPVENKSLRLQKFGPIAERYLHCVTEEIQHSNEVRSTIEYFKSFSPGEKKVEEFFDGDDLHIISKSEERLVCEKLNHGNLSPSSLNCVIEDLKQKKMRDYMLLPNAIEKLVINPNFINGRRSLNESI